MQQFSIVSIVSIFAAIAFSCQQTGKRQKIKPNVLFIAVDDMADWAGCMEGHPDAITPNIDKLASHGLLFTNAHCASPICGPSRASVLTGLRPESSQVYHNQGTYIDYVPEVVALPEYFRMNGYHVMGAGKINHSHTKVVDKNWDEYGPGTGIVGTPFTDHELSTESMDPTITVKRDNWEVTLPMNGISTIDRPYNRWSTFDWGPLPITDDEMPDGQIANWAVDQLDKDYDKPFFLAVGFYKPHQPLFAPQKYFDLYKDIEIHLPPTIPGDLDDLSQTARDYALLPWTSGCHKTVVDHDQWEEGILGYLATLSFVDAQVGKVLDALENSGHRKNTIIVLWSDHGWHLGEKEHWGKHTPWMRSTHVPLIFRIPVMNSENPGQAGETCDEPVNLLDLYPTLVDLCKLPKKASLDGKSLTPLLTDPDKEWEEATITTLGRGSHAINTKQWKYIHYFEGSEELYNLAEDPEEWHNLAADPETQTLRNLLKEYIIEDPSVRHYVRYDRWKAVVKTDNSIMLFDIYGTNGISEQVDMAEEHPEIARTIRSLIADLENPARHLNFTNKQEHL